VCVYKHVLAQSIHQPLLKPPDFTDFHKIFLFPSSFFFCFFFCVNLVVSKAVQAVSFVILWLLFHNP